MQRRLGSVFHLGFDVFLSFCSTFCGWRSFFILFFFCWLGRITFNCNKEKLKIINTNTEDQHQHYTILCWLVIPKVLKIYQDKKITNTSWHTWARDAWFVCVRWCITSKNRKTRKENIKLNFYLIIIWWFLFIITTSTHRKCFYTIQMYGLYQREKRVPVCSLKLSPVGRHW